MKILYVINKMTNLAGIERILSCKMNYLSEKTEHSVHSKSTRRLPIVPSMPLSLNEKV